MRSGSGSDSNSSSPSSPSTGSLTPGNHHKGTVRTNLYKGNGKEMIFGNVSDSRVMCHFPTRFKRSHRRTLNPSHTKQASTNTSTHTSISSMSTILAKPLFLELESEFGLQQRAFNLAWQQGNMMWVMHNSKTLDLKKITK
jgi:hypothetical protein